MNDKLNVLIMIAKVFNEHKIHWNVGASCMLYLRGYVDHFHDIDLMISLDDVEKVKEILKAYPCIERPRNEQYRTRVFLEYTIDGIDLDIMAGFSIMSEQNEYYFPLTKDEPTDEMTLDDTPIFLAKVETWYRYYSLMKREDKIRIIEQHHQKKKE